MMDEGFAFVPFFHCFVVVGVLARAVLWAEERVRKFRGKGGSKVQASFSGQLVFFGAGSVG
jgi:hypothetical protein